MSDQDSKTTQEQEYSQQVTELVGEMLSNFEAWARDLLAYSRGEEAAFQARLRVRWQHAFDLFELAFTEGQRLGHDINEEQRPQAVIDNDLVFETLAILHARAALITSEVYILLRSGHPIGAFARWRSLYELLVVSRLVREHGADLAERFLLHEHVQRWMAVENYQKHAAALGEELLSEQYVEELNRGVEKLRAKYGDRYCKPYGWARSLIPNGKINIDELAKHAKLDHLRPYYGLASDGIHPDIKGLHRTTFTMGENLLLAGPTNYGLADPGQWTLWAFSECTSVFASLKPSPENDAALVRLSLLVSRASKEFVTTQLEIEKEEQELKEENATTS